MLATLVKVRSKSRRLLLSRLTETTYVAVSVEPRNQLMVMDVPDGAEAAFTSVGAGRMRTRRQSPVACPRVDLAMHINATPGPARLMSVLASSWRGGRSTPDEQSVATGLPAR